MKLVEYAQPMNPETTHNVRRAWLLAFAWLAICLVIAAWSGALATLTQAPASHGSLWLVSTAAVTTYALFAYLYFWPLGTENHGRSLEPSWVALFGAVWGLSQGLLLLSIFALATGLLADRVLAAVATFVAYSAFVGAWQRRFWDVYVAPPHNIAEWNLRKLLIAHVPFLALVLAHLVVFGDPVLVIGWFMLVLTACAWSMRMPSPRSS